MKRGIDSDHILKSRLIFFPVFGKISERVSHVQETVDTFYIFIPLQFLPAYIVASRFVFVLVIIVIIVLNGHLNNLSFQGFLQLRYCTDVKTEQYVPTDSVRLVYVSRCTYLTQVLHTLG
jgi:hypothetical protein